MGYRTYHTVTCQTEGDEHELTPEMLKFLISTSGYNEDHFNGCEDAKWYDCNEDMIELSTAFPLTTFRVDGSGETPGDIWVQWYHGGGCIGSWYAPAVVIPFGFEPPREEA